MRPSFTWLAVALAVAASLAATACQERTARLEVKGIDGPRSAEVIDLVARGDRGEPVALARTPRHLWALGKKWERVRNLEGEPGSVEHRNDSLIWARGTWWWLQVEGENAPLLMRSLNGAEWDGFSLPGTARGPGLLADSPAAPTAHLELVEELDAIYLVGSRRIWRLDQSGSPIWHRVDLEGIGPLQDEDAPFPSFIRGYLPRSAERDFELVTVYGEQLKVFRRSSPGSSWAMVASLGVADEELLSAPDGSALFVVAPDGLRRSSDQGETWYRFWPTDAAPLTTLGFVAESSGEVGYAVLAGTKDGAIYRSSDQGIQWEVVHPGGVSGRAITAFGVAPDQISVWAGTAGRGVLSSPDGGKTWSSAAPEIDDAVPRLIDFRAGSELVLGDVGGVWAKIGGLKSDRWDLLNGRHVSALLGTSSTSVVTGTIDGAVLVQSSPEETIETNSLFRERSGPEVRPDWTAALLSERAVLLLEQRPESDTIHAWSRRNGAAVSNDGGQSWESLELDDSFIDALGGAEIESIELGVGRRIYLFSALREEKRLWRSDDEGRSWKAIRDFETKRAQLEVIPGVEGEGERIVALGEEWIELSDDGGETWRSIAGPWEGLDVVAIDWDAGRLAVLVDSRPGFELMVADGVSDLAPSVRRYLLDWPRTPASPPDEFIFRNRGVVMLAADGLWRADLPSAESTIPLAVNVFATSLAIIAACMLAFLIMRQF